MSQYCIKVAKAKLAEKQGLVAEAKKKLKKAKELVVTIEQEVLMAEQEFQAAKTDFEKFQSNEKVSKKSKRDQKEDHTTQGTINTSEVQNSKRIKVTNEYKGSKESKNLEIKRIAMPREIKIEEIFLRLPM